MKRDEHGNRMKGYEEQHEVRLNVHQPIYVRIDGRTFSTFTRDMQKPFDSYLSDAMVFTAEHILLKTGAYVAYVQSDEISLLYKAKTPESSVIFDGRVMKMTSVLASMAAAKFGTLMDSGHRARFPHFDARVCQLPSDMEAANMFLWRYKDATRNAVSMVAQHLFSHKELQNKSTQDMLAMLAEIGVDYYRYPEQLRLGTFLKTKQVLVEPKDNIPEHFRPTEGIMRPVVVRESIAYMNLSTENRINYLYGRPMVSADSV
jgi:tRNA(His) guanylyltransferase